jgi:predicted TIM-barrel fold metal-dependent hydrolase
MTTVSTRPSPRNEWRLATPGELSGGQSVRPGDPRKLLMISADCHANEPGGYLAERIPAEYRDRIPRIVNKDDGSEWVITEGGRPQMVKRPAAAPTQQEQAPFEKPEHNRAVHTRMEQEDVLRSTTGKTIEQRLEDQAADGVDIELIFANKGLTCFMTPDPVFAAAMCAVWNDWAYEWFGGSHGWNDGRTRPLASIATGHPDLAVAEVRKAAGRGFVGLCLGNQPFFGAKPGTELEYNDPVFEPLWSVIEETGLPITFHVSTGRDPRAIGGNGAAIITYVCHSMETTIEPLVQLISSGVLERHPGLQAGMVESGIGYVPWLLETMDHAYRAHHMFVRPVIPELPSHYFRQHCFATFQEDHVGVDTVERFDLENNLMWANDYPHHEGSWPHSAASIERQMGHLALGTRAKLLGENAKRVFRL